MLLVLTLGCGPGYVPPCRVSNQTTVPVGRLVSSSIPFAAPPKIQVIPGARLQLTWWGLTRDYGADAGVPVDTALAETAVITAEDGSIVERHSVPTTVGTGLEPFLSTTQPFFWTGHSVIMVRAREEPFKGPDETEHVHRELQLETRTANGARSVAALSSTSCTDCHIRFFSRWLNGRLVTLYSHQVAGTGGLGFPGLGSLGPGGPAAPAIHFITTTADGTVTASGTLDWLKDSIETVRSAFEGNPRTDLLVVGGVNDFWLTDETLTRRAGPFPFSLPQSFKTDWNADASKIVVSWPQAPRNDLLFQTFDNSGVALSEPKRIAQSWMLDAIAYTEAAVGMTFMTSAQQLVFSTADADLGKVGGEVALSDLPDAGTNVLSGNSVPFVGTGVLMGTDTGFTHVSPGSEITLSQIRCEP